MSRPKEAPTPSTARARGEWQGMNWIRQEKRLAIYLRDGCACCWCGFTLEQGAQLTLDHVLPHSKGGSNDGTNLVTACKRCNDSRGDRGVVEFAQVTAKYLNHGVLWRRIVQHVHGQRTKPIELLAAKALMQRRGTAFTTLQYLKSRS